MPLLHGVAVDRDVNRRERQRLAVASESSGERNEDREPGNL
jgi:hypothetical protein